jgi:hypothetical protein
MALNHACGAGEGAVLEHRQLCGKLDAHGYLRRVIYPHVIAVAVSRTSKAARGMGLPNK